MREERLRGWKNGRTECDECVKELLLVHIKIETADVEGRLLGRACDCSVHVGSVISDF